MTIEEKDLKARDVLDNWKYLNERLEKWDAGYASLNHEYQEWVESKGITGRSILTNGPDYFAPYINNQRLYINAIFLDSSRISNICLVLNLTNAENLRII